MKMNKFVGMAIGSFMTASSAVQAQPVPELYGRPGIPDNNQKINCVREALYYRAGGDRGMIQSTYQENGATVYQFETANDQGATIAWVRKTGNQYAIDVYPEGRNQTARQNNVYEYILLCDPKSRPSP